MLFEESDILEPMKLIVGLGNPGEEYARTRHNLGMMVVDTIASAHGVSFSFKKDFQAEIAQIRIADNDIILTKPHTFMNNSGIAVRAIAHFYKISPEDITVIHDDLDTIMGTVKYISDSQESGSGGHNGIKSVTTELGTAKFSRVKVGIKTEEVDQARASTNKDEKEGKIDHFVLSPFTKEERSVVEPLITHIAESISTWLK